MDEIDIMLSLPNRVHILNKKLSEYVELQDEKNVHKIIKILDIIDLKFLIKEPLLFSINNNLKNITKLIIKSKTFGKCIGLDVDNIVNLVFKRGWYDILDDIPIIYVFKAVLENLNDIKTWRQCQTDIKVDIIKTYEYIISNDDAIMLNELYKCGIKYDNKHTLILILSKNAINCLRAFHILRGGDDNFAIKDWLSSAEYINYSLKSMNLNIISYLYKNNILPYKNDIWLYLLPAYTRGDKELETWLINNLPHNEPINDEILKKHILNLCNHRIGD